MQLPWLDRIGLRPGRFRFLFVTLVAYCVGAAVFPNAADVLGVLLLAATFIELEKDETALLRRAVGLVVVLSVVARISNRATGLDEILFGANVLDVVLAILMTYAVHRAVIRASRPATDRILGAICVYLLLGFAWAAVYSSIETAAPGSFRVPEGLEMASSSSSFIYYSFVTLSTLGYGDVTPATRLAGTAAWLEAITGQLYIAITIASLLAAAISERRQGD
jgi:hypothetical protein